jgi:cytochrome c551/c552
MLQKQIGKGMLWVLFIVVLAVPALARAGGWAVISLEALPQEVVTERPFTIRFAVLQHGLRLADMPSTVTAVHPATSDKVTVACVLAEDGYFEATMTLPQAGQWQWQINSFGYDHVMPPLTVTPAPVMNEMAVADDRSVTPALLLGLLGTAVALWGWRQKQRRLRWALALTALVFVSSGMWLGLRGEATAVAQPTETIAAINPSMMGEALFVAKGCIACHQNDKVSITENMQPFGPNLSQYSGNAEFLAQWLQDPSQIKPETQMPNLHLTDNEIQILAGFLSE